MLQIFIRLAGIDNLEVWSTHTLVNDIHHSLPSINMSTYDFNRTSENPTQSDRETYGFVNPTQSDRKTYGFVNALKVRHAEFRYAVSEMVDSISGWHDTAEHESVIREYAEKLEQCMTAVVVHEVFGDVEKRASDTIAAMTKIEIDQVCTSATISRELADFKIRTVGILSKVFDDMLESVRVGCMADIGGIVALVWMGHDLTPSLTHHWENAKADLPRVTKGLSRVEIMHHVNTFQWNFSKYSGPVFDTIRDSLRHRIHSTKALVDDVMDELETQDDRVLSDVGALATIVWASERVCLNRRRIVKAEKYMDLAVITPEALSQCVGKFIGSLRFRTLTTLEEELLNSLGVSKDEIGPGEKCLARVDDIVHVNIEKGFVCGTPDSIARDSEQDAVLTRGGAAIVMWANELHDLSITEGDFNVAKTSILRGVGTAFDVVRDFPEMLERDVRIVIESMLKRSSNTVLSDLIQSASEEYCPLESIINLVNKLLKDDLEKLAEPKDDSSDDSSDEESESEEESSDEESSDEESEEELSDEDERPAKRAKVATFEDGFEVTFTNYTPEQVKYMLADVLPKP